MSSHDPSTAVGRLLTLALLLYALTATPSFVTPANASSSPVRLQTYQSAQYAVHTNLPPAEAKFFADHMDIVCAAYQRRFGWLRQRSRREMPLYLFATADDYVTFMAHHGINAANSAGMFFVSDDLRGLATFVRGQDRTEVLATLRHEGFHQIAWGRIDDEIPIWVNEGLAQYFETGIVIDRRMTLGLVDPHALAVIKHAMALESTVPFQDMLAISPRQWSFILQRDPATAQILYAQAWSMCYFLIESNQQHRANLQRYIMLLNKGRPSRRAWEQTFGPDIPGFERAWHRFVSALEPDPVTLAVQRMRFIARGILTLARDNQPVPADLATLQQQLADRNFTVQHRAGLLEKTYDATDPALWTYPLNQSAQSFQMLPPRPAHALPNLTAPGLNPQPTLNWHRDTRDEPFFEINFR